MKIMNEDIFEPILATGVEDLSSKIRVLTDELETSKQEIKELKNANKKLTDIVNSNYTVVQAIFKQNEIMMKRLEKRIDHSLHFIYICIGLTGVILGIMAYIIFSMHFGY